MVVAGRRTSVRAEASTTELVSVVRKLEAYCRERDWVGADPYDALNSQLFSATPLANSRYARLAFTQALKRSPVDVRPWLRMRSHLEAHVAEFRGNAT